MGKAADERELQLFCLLLGRHVFLKCMKGAQSAFKELLSLPAVNCCCRLA
jgi:hypothetical protein